MQILRIVGTIFYVIVLGIIGMIVGAIFGMFGYASIGVPKRNKIKKERQPFEDI